MFVIIPGILLTVIRIVHYVWPNLTLPQSLVPPWYFVVIFVLCLLVLAISDGAYRTAIKYLPAEVAIVLSDLIQDGQAIVDRLSALTSTQSDFIPQVGSGVMSALAWSHSVGEYIRNFAPDRSADFSRPLTTDDYGQGTENKRQETIAALRQRIEFLFQIKERVSARPV